MHRYKNILVAVDDSEASLHALKESIRLAQWGKGGATVIHVAPFYEGDLSLVGVKNIKAALNGLGESILQEAMAVAAFHDLPIDTILARGEIHESIARHALMQDIDLIVLGAKKTSFVGRLFAGKVLTDVIAVSSKDVLVIPHHTTISWGKLLFPVDSLSNDLEAAERIVELARAYGAELSTLMITKALVRTGGNSSSGNQSLSEKDAFRYLESVQKAAQDANVKSESRMAKGRFPRVVNTVARQELATMIAIALHKKTRPHWRFGRTSITSVIYNSPCPVLLFRGSPS